LGWKIAMHRDNLVFRAVYGGDLTLADSGSEARDIYESVHDGTDNREIFLSRVNENH
jgi:hypothetical protein